MRNLDFSSWNGALTTLLGLVLVSVVAVGIRLLLMQTIQRRRERENRQINERLRTLIAAYKILGGSFTGELSVDPAHLRACDRRTAMNRKGLNRWKLAPKWSSDGSRNVRTTPANPRCR